MSDTSPWVARLADARVLVVGDVMLDRFVSGDAERLSPEAPVPVLRVTQERAMLGGAGNVVRNLAALGAVPEFLTVVGDDTIGREVQRLSAETFRAADFVVQPGRRTAIKTRYIAGGQQLLRADDEQTDAVEPDTRDRVLAAVRAALGNKSATPGAIVLSDYGKGLLTPDLLRAVIDLARAQDIPVLVDPKGRDFTQYAGADIITPNRKELAEATDMPTAGDAAIEAAARHIITGCGIDRVLATRGPHGMTLVGKEDAAHFPAQAREIFDVSGAGDTVIAITAAAIAVGAPLSIAVQLANAAAGVVVGKAGTAVVRPEELAAAVDGASQGVVIGRDEAAVRAEAWRGRGLSVGFTNGCFDLLHPGHISLLRQARDACDRLIVGINTDASVADLKGPGRPVQTETARATVLAALSAVDLVVSFGEETPATLIEALRPDVLVKGADYTIDTVIGADFVQSYGGRVVLARLLDGHSTTGTLSRLKPDR